MKTNFENLPKAVDQLNQKISNLEKLLIERNEIALLKQKEELLSVQQAAVFLNLSVPTIYSKTSRGELPFMKRSKRLYFSQKDLLEYVKVGRNKTIQEKANDVDIYLSSKK